jgi:uncharacterized protein (DUF58 family)
VKRRNHLGVPFWSYCGLTIIIGFAAMNGGSNLLFWVFGVMASALLVSGIVSGAMMLGLRVRRVLPAHGVAGDALSIRYAVRNRSLLLPAFNVDFHERPVTENGAASGGWQRLMESARGWVLHIGPRETVHGEAIFHPLRRGVAHLDALRMRSSFPFGIIGKSVTVSQPQRLLVHPRRFPLRHRVLEAIAPGGTLGMSVTQHAGAGDDYYGLREFRPGDSMRHVAWKRTANRDELVCVERTRPTPPRLLVVLNLTAATAMKRPGTPAAPASAELEERAICLAASIVHAADLAGYELGLAVLGMDRPMIPVRHSHWHRQRIMAALAEVDLSAPRLPPRDLGVEPERAGIVVVHPEHPDPAVVRGEAWHFSARQIERLVEWPDEGVELATTPASTEAAA